MKVKVDERTGTPEEIKIYSEMAKQMNYNEYAPKDGEITTKTSLERLIDCDHVYEIIPKFQSEVCTKGYKHIDLIQSYLILAVFVYLISFAMTRLANYIQKKIDEKKVIFLFRINLIFNLISLT